MKIEIRGTPENCSRAVVTLDNGDEFDITEQFGALRVNTWLDSQNFYIRPCDSCTVELSVRERKQTT